MVLKGQAMKNPDGSSDNCHEQKTHYGIAFADLVLACPLSIAGIILIFVTPRWGYYLLALVSFWFVWTNTMTTATSLRFENPKISFNWFMVFPFGSLLSMPRFYQNPSLASPGANYSTLLFDLALRPPLCVSYYLPSIPILSRTLVSLIILV